MQDPNQSYTNPLDNAPVDPERDWARSSRDLGMMSPHRGFERASEAGIVGNRGRAMDSSRKYTEGYQISPVTSANSRNTSRDNYARMTIDPPAEVLNVTKPMG